MWKVIKHDSASVGFEEYRPLLWDAAQRLPEGVKVVLLADRGFVHTQAMSLITTELGWHYRIRLKGDTWVKFGAKGWRQLHTLHLNPGEARCFHTVKIHKAQAFGPVHVAYGCNPLNGQYWAIVSDEPTTLQTFREYGLRFDIEEAFLDDQSGGWNLQKCEIRSVEALSRLWFLLAVATLYVTAQGLQVVESGQRHRVDPHWFRGNSYFRIGWDWVKTALRQGWRLIKTVHFSSGRDPEPAMASRPKHQQRSHSLEFQVSTECYPP
jgi:hypothetical protein